MRLTGIDVLKNEAGIWLRTARNAAAVLLGKSTARTAEQIHDEYTNLPKDWETLDNPVLVRANGLQVITHRKFREQYAAIIEQAIGITGAKRIIEFGCGEGLNYGMLKTKVEGFDLVPERIRRAKERFPEGKFWIGDATVPQAAPDSYDLAFSCHAIEQMQDVWSQAIARMRELAPFVLLMEPFYERKDIHARLHTRVNGYFRGTLEEVMKIGFAVEREFPVPYVEPFNTTTAILLRRV